MATRLALALLIGLTGFGGAATDPLAAELERLAAFVASTTSADPLWADVKPGAEAALARAGNALRDGRRLLALQRLASARINLAAAAYLFERSANERSDEAAFEAEWARMRGELARGFAPADFDDVRPAAVRAQAEAAFCEIPILHASSLDYGRATDFETGLFYLGQARAQLEFADLCRTLHDESAAAARPAPPLRDLGPELDALETRVLAAYVPPAALERHSEFITVSSLLKQARELNGKALRRGALLEYLHAVMRFAALRAALAPVDASGDGSQGAAADGSDTLAARLDEAAARFAADAADQSLGALFVETAQAELAAATAAATAAHAATSGTPATPTPLAAAIVSDVLPAYAAALAPAPAAPERVASQLDVTLVRWPFT